MCGYQPRLYIEYGRLFSYLSFTIMGPSLICVIVNYGYTYSMTVYSHVFLLRIFAIGAGVGACK